MDIKIDPFVPAGRVRVPASKSDTHRLLILSALCGGVTRIGRPLFCEDTDATAACLKELGADLRTQGDAIEVRGIRRRSGIPHLFAGESGSTLRFLLPVACALYPEAEFDAAPGLRSRPLRELMDCLSLHGVQFSSDRLPFRTRGLLQKGDYRISSAVSSQYVSGLMMAAPLTGGRVIPDRNGESLPYIELTRKRMELFLQNGQYTSPGTVTAEGDWSSGAALLCLGAVSPEGVCVTGLDPTSVQGDAAILGHLSGFGARIAADQNGITVKKGSFGQLSVSLSDTPDLIGPLAFLAVLGSGESVLTDVQRLRYKECDRPDAVSQIIRSLGGEVRCENGALIIPGRPLSFGHVSSFGDHRMAMAAALMGCGKGVVIEDAGVVGKSCPEFFTLYQTLGGKIHVL